MIYYLTGASEAHIRTVLAGIYEGIIGRQLPVDPVTGLKSVPQNDGIYQANFVFSDTDLALPDGISSPLAAGHHVLLQVHATANNPTAELGDATVAAITAAGITVVDAANIDTTHLPAFQ